MEDDSSRAGEKILEGESTGVGVGTQVGEVLLRRIS